MELPPRRIATQTALPLAMTQDSPPVTDDQSWREGEHAIEITTTKMAVGGYFRSVCACGDFTSRPCGSQEKAIELGIKHRESEGSR